MAGPGEGSDRLVQPQADHGGGGADIVDGNANIRQRMAGEVVQHRLPDRTEADRRGQDLDAAGAAELGRLDQNLQIAGPTTPGR